MNTLSRLTFFALVSVILIACGGASSNESGLIPSAVDDGVEEDLITEPETSEVVVPEVEQDPVFVPEQEPQETLSIERIVLESEAAGGNAAVYRELVSGSIIDLNDVDLDSVDISVELNDEAFNGSVEFVFSGATEVRRTINSAPYSFGTDIVQGLVDDESFAYDATSLTVNLYELPGATGNIVYQREILIRVAEFNSEEIFSENVPYISRIGLARKTVEEVGRIQFSDLIEVREIVDRDEIELSQYQDLFINLIAVSSNENATGSVNFELVGPTSLTRHENYPPYTLATEPENWDVSGGEPLPGDYTLKVTPYELIDLGGEAGKSYAISFTISEGEVEVVEETLPFSAANDTFVVYENQTLGNVSVSTNDRIDLALANYDIVDFPLNGVVEMDIDGSFLYTPDSGFAGTDSFVYQVLQEGNVSTATSTVRVLRSDSSSTSPDGGWTDFVATYIVESDGSHSLGNPTELPNATRDQGSKISYFDTISGNNTTAQVYWYKDGQIVDSEGKSVNDDGEAYGINPLEPNLAAIKPFRILDASNDSRLKTQNNGRFARLAGRNPDWFLFRRGQVHTDFDETFTGGRTESMPMVVASYGPKTEVRAIIEPDEDSMEPFNTITYGASQAQMHLAVKSLVLHTKFSFLGFHTADSPSGGPATAHVEDVRIRVENDNAITYPPKKTRFYRTTIDHAYRESSAHVQGFYTDGDQNQVTFDTVMFYQNGFKSNPIDNEDPIYDIFSRNVYQGGGAQMGFTYRNMISMDGGSGGPQMRFGGLMEHSLIIEGYFFSSTNSNSARNSWLESGNQSGQSAEVRNNLQYILVAPTPADPDTPQTSDPNAHPGAGYSLTGATFGTTVEGNIISGAMLVDDLGGELPRYGIAIDLSSTVYSNGTAYNQKNNTVRNNVVYKTSEGISVRGDAEGVSNILIEDNIVVSPVGGLGEGSGLANLSGTNQVLARNNELFTDTPLINSAWLAQGNTIENYNSGVGAQKRFADPDRTLKRYLTEELGLTLMEWSDDPYMDQEQKQARIAAGEIYDPTGMRTFATIVAQMREGGTVPVPSSGKPAFDVDYAWDNRLTAKSVINWVREGFNMDPIE